uniref:Uncharacterized protein n=1 Tax=Knipowitschia caucasica TaxID=637954 RepID=A0AAV2K0G6_KNICA
MVALARMFQSDRPATYCKVNVVVPILRLWLDVELDTKPDFRLSRQAMHSLQRGCYGERMKRTGLVKREDCFRMELEKQTGSMVQRRQSPTEYPHWGSRQD